MIHSTYISVFKQPKPFNYYTKFINRALDVFLLCFRKQKIQPSKMKYSHPMENTSMDHRTISLVRMILGSLIATLPMLGLVPIAILTGSSLNLTWFEILYMLGLALSGALASYFFTPRTPNIIILRARTFMSFLIPFALLNYYRFIQHIKTPEARDFLTEVTWTIAVTIAGSVWFWYIWLLLYGYLIRRLKISPWQLPF